MNKSTMSISHNPPVSPEKTKANLGKQLDDIGWGLFLVVLGVLSILPDSWAPKGTLLITTGLLLLALDVVRYVKGITWSTFTAVLGILALATGLADLVDMKLPILAISLIAIGLSILLRAVMVRHR